jgi:signal peptidase II
MIALCLTVFVLVSDQAVKLLLHRGAGAYAIPLGPFGTIRMVAARLWLRRLGVQCNDLQLWCLWMAAAASLVVVSILLPSSAAFVGLLLGGSLSHGIESSMHGEVADYICLRFWPAFNLADLAVAVGVIGMTGELLSIIGVMIF